MDTVSLILDDAEEAAPCLILGLLAESALSRQTLKAPPAVGAQLMRHHAHELVLEPLHLLAGIHLAGGPSAATEIPSALTRVLTDPTYRTAAQAVAADMAALPDVAEAVPILNEVAGASAR